jgi:hypothetical protein
MTESIEEQWRTGDKVRLGSRAAVVEEVRFDTFGPRHSPRIEQVAQVRFLDGSSTVMRSAHFSPAADRSES